MGFFRFFCRFICVVFLGGGVGLSLKSTHILWSLSHSLNRAVVFFVRDNSCKPMSAKKLSRRSGTCLLAHAIEPFRIPTLLPCPHRHTHTQAHGSGFAETEQRTAFGHEHISRPASINLASEGIDKQTKRGQAVSGLGKLMTRLAAPLLNLLFTALPLHV